MPVITNSFDLHTVEWRLVSDPTFRDYRVDFAYSLLGYDRPSGRLDILLRFGKDGGYCRRHRHVASTATLVLEGEQIVTEIRPDGETKTTRRKKGDYALAPADALPHDECGGKDGGTVLLSMTASDGILFEYCDENMENPWTLSLDEYVENWNNNTFHGAPKG